MFQQNLWLKDCERLDQWNYLVFSSDLRNLLPIEKCGKNNAKNAAGLKKGEI